MNPLEFHLLLALARSPLYGYAITDAIARESGGSVTPRAGSLYRVLARLMAAGQVAEVAPPAGTPANPGLARRYYALTPAGRRALGAETERLKRTAALAARRLRPAAERP